MGGGTANTPSHATMQKLMMKEGGKQQN